MNYLQVCSDVNPELLLSAIIVQTCQYHHIECVHPIKWHIYMYATAQTTLILLWMNHNIKWYQNLQLNKHYKVCFSMFRPKSQEICSGVKNRYKLFSKPFWVAKLDIMQTNMKKQCNNSRLYQSPKAIEVLTLKRQSIYYWLQFVA